MTEPTASPPPASSPPGRTAPSAGRIYATMVAVLLIGIFTGVVLDRMLPRRVTLWRGRPPFGAPFGRPPGMGHLDERMARELGLTPEQRVRIDSIVARHGRELDSARRVMQPQMRAMFERMRDEMDSVLTPAQREKLHAMFPHHHEPPPPP